MVFVDLDLARQLEGIEAWWASEFARVRQEIRPEADTAVVRVAGGYACFLGEGAPINEAKGMGMDGPVSVADFEAMERVFFDRKVTAKVMVCPLADPSLLQGLASRGYRSHEFEDVLYRVLDPSEEFPSTPEGIELGWASLDEVAICGETLARGFVAPDEPDEALLGLFEISSMIAGTAGLLAKIQGLPAGAASLLIRDGLAMLGGAWTLPIYRNRGIQTALSHARLGFASKSGCIFAVVGAVPGSTSHRNAERLGFRVAYTKLALLRDP
jgi:GNAT superfamily N-acetyltransferase